MEKGYSRGSQQLGEARVVDHGEDVLCETPVCGPGAAYYCLYDQHFVRLQRIGACVWGVEVHVQPTTC